MPGTSAIETSGTTSSADLRVGAGGVWQPPANAAGCTGLSYAFEVFPYVGSVSPSESVRFSVSSSSSSSSGRENAKECSCESHPERLAVASKEANEKMNEISFTFIEMLVFGCIDASDSENWRIFQHVSRYTRFTDFCTAPTSIYQQKKVVQNFQNKI